MGSPGGAKVYEYVELRLPDLQALDRAKTVFLMSVSPVEVHGPHLPVGTDVFVSEELVRRYIAELGRRHPELTFVKLPALYAGSDALPVPGSLSVPAPYLEGMLVAYGRGLAKQGFRYLFVSDNHGGPRHQMAVESAARTLWRRHRFYLIDPFGVDYRLMVQHDPEFLRRTGLAPGTCGDDADNHAGTNETSLMLACDRTRVAEGFREVGPSELPARRGAAALVAGLGWLVRSLGGRVLGADLDHLANTLAWVSDPAMKPYMGNPSKASADAGEAMLTARVGIGIGLFERALASAGKEPVHITPMLWGVRFLRRLPE